MFCMGFSFKSLMKLNPRKSILGIGICAVTTTASATCARTRAAS